MILATIIVYSFYFYLLTGILFATWFALRGVNHVDPGMHEVSWGVRALIFPGSVLLWPVLLRKYLRHR